MILGITQRVFYYEKYNEIWECLDSKMAEFFADLGFVSVGLSFKQKENLGEILRLCDGFVLSGGNDLGEFKERDEFEFELLNLALKSGKKVLGVCRGMQIIAKHFGVNLSPSKHEIATPHALKGALNHSVKSYHKFCIKTAPKGFEILAKVNDEIEAMKAPQILALMWHFEREFNEIDKKLIKRFLKDENV